LSESDIDLDSGGVIAGGGGDGSGMSGSRSAGSAMAGWACPETCSQLRSLDPPLSESDIDLERRALDAAIERLEIDHGGCSIRQRVEGARQKRIVIGHGALVRPLRPPSGSTAATISVTEARTRFRAADHDITGRRAVTDPDGRERPLARPF
jgi:hypothetical protein